MCTMLYSYTVKSVSNSEKTILKPGAIIIIKESFWLPYSDDDYIKKYGAAKEQELVPSWQKGYTYIFYLWASKTSAAFKLQTKT